MFGTLLFWISAQRSFLLLLLFLAAAFYFYFRKLLEWRKFFYAFLVLIFYSLIVINFFNNQFFSVVSSVFFAALFFMILGIKNFVFIDRETIFNFLYWILYFVASIVFFAGEKAGTLNLLGYSVLTFFVFYLLSKESLDFLYSEVSVKKRRLLALGVSFITIQAAHIIRWLPLGFLNSAVMATLLIVVLEDLISYHLKGALNRQTIIKNAVVLLVMVFLIFLAVRFQI